MNLQRHHHAYTLIELLLVVSLVGVLVFLLLPALSRFRNSARDLTSIVNMHSHAQILSAYAGDHNDYFPAITHLKATWSVIRGCGSIHQVPYFHAAYLWNVALCDSYYDGSPFHASFSHPSLHEELPGNSYLLTASYMAMPQYWTAESRLAGNQQWAHSRVSNTVFASSKAVLTEWHPRSGLPLVATNPIHVGLAFVDGSAGRIDAVDLIDPYPQGDGGGHGGFLPIGVYGVHTIDGWRGRDRR